MGLRNKAEKYGFVVCLSAQIHPNGARNTDPNWVDFDHWLKRKCQEYYVEVAKIGTREDFLNEFGRFYDDRCDEKTFLNKTFEWDLRREE